MRKTLLSILFTAITAIGWAQLQFNPQVGGSFTDLTNDPNGITTKAAFGFLLGADMRIGDRIYFQPGVFFGRNATVVKVANGDTATVEDNLIRTTFKVKALAGFNIIHKEAFKLRVNAGPTYEVLLSVDSKDDKIQFNKDDYNAGSFNMDAGVGLDISLLTLESGISYGLSNTYKDSGELKSDSKYFTYYLTIGLVFGSSGN